MGLHFELGLAQEQQTDLKQRAKSVATWCEDNLLGIQDFTNNSTQALQGAAYDTARDWFGSVHVPLLRGIMAAYQQLAQASERFVGDYEAGVANQTLDEDDLEDKVKAAENRLCTAMAAIDRVEQLLKHTDGVLPGAENAALGIAKITEATLSSQIAEFKRLLKKLRAYEPATANLLATVLATWSQVQQGLKTLSNTHFDANSDTFSAAGDLAWATALNDAYLTSEFGQIKVPAGLTPDEAEAYRRTVRTQMAALADEGWNTAAIKAYLKQTKKYVGAQLAAENKNLEVLLQTMDQRAHTVGSNVFTGMFDAACPNTKAGQAKTIAMYNVIVGARIDGDHFLQLDNVGKGRKYQFPTSSDGMVHYLHFVEHYANAIEDKYAGEGNTENELDDKIDNQMRYWLDKPMVTFINKRGYNQKEYEAWLKRHGFTVDHPGPGLHRRTVKKSKDHPQNRKVTGANNHVEIIFTPDGEQTVSMWNELERDKSGNIIANNKDNRYTEAQMQNIANTDSANYATPNPDVTFFGVTVSEGNSGDHHVPLDVGPADYTKGLESDIRVRAKRFFSNGEK